MHAIVGVAGNGADLGCRADRFSELDNSGTPQVMQQQPVQARPHKKTPQRQGRVFRCGRRGVSKVICTDG